MNVPLGALAELDGKPLPEERYDEELQAALDRLPRATGGDLWQIEELIHELG